MNLTTFSPAVRDLLSADRLNPLGPGSPNEPMRARLEGLTLEALLAPHPLRRAADANACLAGLWLYHDFLDESHQVSQGLATVEGSYWHGIMHRREPDYGNAAYWFRRVGRHPVFEPLAAVAQELARETAVRVTIPPPWDPFWFIDYCEACAKGRESGEHFARLVQQREWELLFEYCYRRAIE